MIHHRRRRVLAALTLTVLGLGGLVAVPAVRAAVGECVTGYDSKGRAGVYGAVLEIPFENYAGSPYVESELSSLPKSRALAATFYEGFAAAIVLGTADVDYENPTLSEAHYPAVSGTQEAGPREPAPGLVLDTNAEERLVEAYASFPGGEIPGLGQFGSAYAQSTATFDGEAVRGVDQVWTYDLRLGDAHVNQVRSVVTYATDGTAEGTAVSWEIEFGGIRQAGDPEGRLSGDGVVIQGGDPQPGSEPRTSFDEAVAELSSQLDDAGVGQVNVEVQPGRIETSEGEVRVRSSGITFRVAPRATRGAIGHAVGLGFARIDRDVLVRRGSCSGSSALPAIGTVTPPAGSTSGSSDSARPSVAPSASSSSAGSSLTPDADDVASDDLDMAAPAGPTAPAAAMLDDLWTERFYRRFMAMFLLGTLVALGVGVPLFRHQSALLPVPSIQRRTQ